MAGAESPVLGAAIKTADKPPRRYLSEMLAGGGTPACYSSPPTVEQPYGWFGQPFRQPNTKEADSAR